MEEGQSQAHAEWSINVGNSVPEVTNEAANHVLPHVIDHSSYLIS